MILRDAAPVGEIEKLEPSGWQRPLILAELDQVNSVQLVASRDSRVIGWCCCRYVGQEGELLKIGVAAEFRRQKISTRLLGCLEERLCELAVQTVFLEVRSQNRPALSFYHKTGFTEVSRRLRYYTQPVDDALILHKTI